MRSIRRCGTGELRCWFWCLLCSSGMSHRGIKSSWSGGWSLGIALSWAATQSVTKGSCKKNSQKKCHHIDPCISIIVARAPTTTPPTLSTTATQAPSTPSASVPPPSKRSFPIFSNPNQMSRRAQMCANWGWILTRWRSNSRIRSLTSAHQTGFSHQIDPKTMIDPRTYVIIDQPHDWPKLWRQSSFALFRCL